MILNTLFGALALSAGCIDGALTLSTKLLRSRDSNAIEGPSLVPRQDTTATCLAAKSIATASFLDGQGKGADGVAAGQSPSDTYVLLVSSFRRLLLTCLVTKPTSFTYAMARPLRMACRIKMDHATQFVWFMLCLACEITSDISQPWATSHHSIIW